MKIIVPGSDTRLFHFVEGGRCLRVARCKHDRQYVYDFHVLEMKDCRWIWSCKNAVLIFNSSLVHVFWGQLNYAEEVAIWVF